MLSTTPYLPYPTEDIIIMSSIFQISEQQKMWDQMHTIRNDKYGQTVQNIMLVFFLIQITITFRVEQKFCPILLLKFDCIFIA